jgi:hypothetical protein
LANLLIKKKKKVFILMGDWGTFDSGENSIMVIG